WSDVPYLHEVAVRDRSGTRHLGNRRCHIDGCLADARAGLRLHRPGRNRPDDLLLLGSESGVRLSERRGP
ncbi:MAG TPA: hypothetical protein VKD90_29940, partial [Gemmataceae bacterium]|nr:hypothetical protein [Gemmataceae bacterium]